VPADSPVKKAADLSGKRLGGPRGGLQEMLFTKKLQSQNVFRSPVRFIGFENPPEGLTALQGGSVDGYTSDGPIVYGLLKSTPDQSKWRVFDLGVDASPQAFPIRQNSSSFATLINSVQVKPIWVYSILAVLYLVSCFTFSRCVHRIERRTAKLLPV